MKSFTLIEKVGISKTSYEEAIANIVKTITDKQIGWYEVTELRGRVSEDGQLEYQVKVKIAVKD